MKMERKENGAWKNHPTLENRQSLDLLLGISGDAAT